MNFPDDLRYSSDHEWVRLEGGTVRIGITDFAQDTLGGIVFVALPNVGDEVAAGASFGEVESHKSVSEVYAPVAGTITARNDVVETAPETINEDPYGAGWLVQIRPVDEPAAADFLDAAAYDALAGG